MSEKPKKGDIIKVDWVDQSYYMGPAEADGATQECYGSSIGYFLERSEKWLCIGMEKFETDRTSYRHILTFPVQAVQTVTIIAKGARGR